MFIGLIINGIYGHWLGYDDCVACEDAEKVLTMRAWRMIGTSR